MPPAGPSPCGDRPRRRHEPSPSWRLLACAVCVVALASSLVVPTHAARVLSSVSVRRQPSQPSASQSKLIKSISRALDSGAPGIGIPSVDQIIKSTSTLSASPSTASSAAPSAASSSAASPRSLSSAAPSNGAKHHRKRKPNKVTVISNLNVMQHNEVPPARVDLVALSEQNSKTQQEHRRKQVDAEARDLRVEEARKHERALNEQDTKADIADANAEAAESNLEASQEADNKRNAAAAAQMTQATAAQNANENTVKTQLQAAEQATKNTAVQQMNSQASAEQKNKATAVAQAAQFAAAAAAQAKQLADQAKQQADEQASKAAQEDKSKQQYVLNAGPLQPTKGFILAAESKIKPVPQWAYMMWLKPLDNRTNTTWSSIMHHGNTDSDRNPSVLFYPASTRLHIRSGSKENWNGGFDSTDGIPSGAWTHLALVHRADGLSVYLNGVKLGQDNNSGPLQKTGTLYVSSPWYDAARVSIADLRFFDRFVEDAEVAAVNKLAKHPA